MRFLGFRNLNKPQNCKTICVIFVSLYYIIEPLNSVKAHDIFWTLAHFPKFWDDNLIFFKLITWSRDSRRTQP